MYAAISEIYRVGVICRNGESVADSEHIVGELMKGLMMILTDYINLLQYFEQGEWTML